MRAVFWSAALATKDLIDIDENDDDEDDDDDDDDDDSSANNEDDECDDDDDDETDEDENNNKSKNSASSSHNSSLSNKFDLLAVEKVDDEADENESSSSTSTAEEEDDDEEDEEQTTTDDEKEEDDDDDEETEEKEEKGEKVAQLPDTKPAEASNEQEKRELVLNDEEAKKCKILNCSELIALFKSVHAHIVDKAKPGCTTIGLVGYPNVGKSSTINALLHDKKTAVSETPGKTKHYQTLFVDDELLLCDCPGLVFPSFVSTRGELIVNGILPIDQMRDYVEPVNLIVEHIPVSVFEMIYGLEVPKLRDGRTHGLNAPSRAEELASAYALYRGYLNHKGTPDVQRAARYMLKDYVNGKLLYCYPPPGCPAPLAFQDHRYEVSKEIKYMERVNKLLQRVSLFSSHTTHHSTNQTKQHVNNL